MAKRIAKAAFDLLLHIDGVEYRCAEVSINYGLNKIPVASCRLAVGRDVKTLQRAPVHDNARNFIQMLPAKITLAPSGQWLPDDLQRQDFFGRWSEAGQQVIFDGYLAAYGSSRNFGQASPVVHLIHWLSDLSFSSVLSGQSHPANPAKFRWWAASSPTGVSTTAKTEFIGSFATGSLFDSGTILSDFWGDSLHQFFAELSESDILWQFGVDACTGINSTNEAAKNALKRFERRRGTTTAIGPDHRTGAQSPWHKPLSIRFGGVESLVAKSIGNFIKYRTVDSYFNATVWDKLIGELGPAFYFSIVPRVETAMVVPFVPGLRQTFGEEYGNNKVLDLQDMVQQDTSATSMRPLRAVGILPSNMPSELGIEFGVPVNTLGGCFAPDANAPGMVMYLQPPRWLNDVPIHAHDPKQTVFQQAPGSATTPVFNINPPEPAGTPAKATNQLADYYQRVARYMYAQEMLRGRFLVVSGKLRFDLAPGSTVLVRNAPQTFIGNGDQLAEDMVASVSRLSIVLNAMTPAAATTFQLDYLRTTNENTLDRTSIDFHPLYDQVFTGAPLVDAYLFPE